MILELKYSTEWFSVGKSNLFFKEFNNFDEALAHFNSLDQNHSITSARLIVTHARIKKQ